MNQTQTLPFEVTIPIEIIKDRFSVVKDMDKVLDIYFKESKTDFFNFYPFGAGISEMLGKHRRFDDHRKFVNIYNSLLNEYFIGELDLVNYIYNTLYIHEGFTVIFGKRYLTLRDKTDIFDGHEFKIESHLENILFESFKSWDISWCVKRQQRIGEGISDLSIISNKEKLAIELKKGVSTRKDVYQAYEYTKANSNYKAILIAKRFDDTTLKLADELGINCYEYCLATFLGESVPCSVYLEPVNSSVQKTQIENDFLIINECDGHSILFKDFVDSVKAEKEALLYVKKLINDLKRAVDYIQAKKKEMKCPYCNENIEIR